MVTLESSDGISNPESDSVTTAVLNTSIETLIAFKDIFDATPLKGVFESVILILTIVRVRLPVLFLFFRRLIGGMTRAR